MNSRLIIIGGILAKGSDEVRLPEHDHDGDLDHLLCSDGTGQAGFWVRTDDRFMPPLFGKCGRHVVHRDHP